MDEFLKDIYTQVFKEWILNEKEKNYDVSIEGIEENIIVIKNKYCYSQVIFNRMNIIELCVTNNLTNESEFYLHFQMTTLKHAIELFREMLESIRKVQKKKTLKILLSCSGGLTTGYFALKLNEATKIIYKDYQIDAIGYQELFNKGEQYDIICLAPQISYMHAKVQKILKNKIVLNIPSQIFAKYDINGFFQLIQKALKNKKEIKEENKSLALKNIDKSGQKILCLSFIRNSERIHIVYRLFNENNQSLLDNEIIKLRISLTDIFDIIDTMIVQYPDIKTVGIAIPGIINNGFVTSTNLNGLTNISLYDAFKERYTQRLVISNDVNAVAVGYYASQSQYSSLSFIFQPISVHSGIGNIIDGKLLTGHSNIAGEAQYLPLALSDEKLVLNKTPEGAIELVAKQMAALISLLDPQAIIYTCVLIPHIEELKQEIKKYIPEHYIPDIIKIDYLQEYIIMGQFLLCLQKGE